MFSRGLQVNLLYLLTKVISGKVVEEIDHIDVPRFTTK